MRRGMRHKATVVLECVLLALAVTTFRVTAEPELDIDSTSVVTGAPANMTGSNSYIGYARC